MINRGFNLEFVLLLAKDTQLHDTDLRDSVA